MKKYVIIKCPVCEKSFAEAICWVSHFNVVICNFCKSILKRSCVIKD